VPAYEQFRNDQAHWLEDYALFPLLENQVHTAHTFLTGPRELVEEFPSLGLAEARRELSDTIDQLCFAQFLIFRQGERAESVRPCERRAPDRRLPFFVSPDSRRCLGRTPKSSF